MMHQTSLVCCLLGAVAFSSALDPTQPPTLELNPVGFSIASVDPSCDGVVVEPPEVTKPPQKLSSSYTSAPEPRGNASARSATALNSGPVGGPVCSAEKFTSSNTKPFNDRNHSYCGQIPEAWNGAWHFSCPHCVTCPTSVNITCPNDWEACELLVNLYICPGCSSSNTTELHGLWPSSLPEGGWRAARNCSSSFCSDLGRHPFISFHKQILGGEMEMLPETATNPTMYFSFIVMEGRACDAITNETACREAAFCGWSAGGGIDNTDVCISDWCPTTPTNGTGGGNCGPCAPGTPAGDCEV